MKPRTFTEPERLLLRFAYALRFADDGEPVFPVLYLCRVLACSSKTLVKEVRALGLPLRKPQRGWA